MYVKHLWKLILSSLADYSFNNVRIKKLFLFFPRTEIPEIRNEFPYKN